MTALPGATIWRDYVTDGVPSSGVHKPLKSDVRAWSTTLEYLANLAFASSLVYSTRAALYANLVPGANTPALVIGDPTAGYDGIYAKNGGTGTGSWTRLGDVPGYNVVRFSNAGAGTTNAIVATAPAPVSTVAGAQIYTVNITTTNSGNVTLNGTALLSSSGNQIASGGLVAGMNVAFIYNGTNYRLLSDQASAAIQAAAEAAKVAAESARDIALAAAASVVASKFSSQAAAAAFTISALAMFIEVAGKVYRRVDADHPRLGPELLGNGSFATDTVWTKGTGYTISGGEAHAVAGSTSNLNQTIAFVDGAAYWCNFTLSDVTGGTVSARFFGGTTVTPVSPIGTNGYKSGVAIAQSGNTSFNFNKDASFAGDIDDASLKALPWDAFQSADGAWWAQPVIVSAHIPYSNDGKYTVFGIAGQSNALGSSVGGDMTINPNVFVYRSGTGIVVADPTLAPFGGTANNAGWQAAKRFQETHGGKVLLIVVAQGSTSIDQFMPSGSPYNGGVVGTQWTKMITDVPAALALIGQTHVDRWMFSQGESDTTTGCIVYMRKVEYFLDAMRAQTYWLKGWTYMVATEMAQAWNNSMQGQGLALRLLSEKTSDFVTMSSFDIPSDAVTPVHFSGQGLVDLGIRFAQMIAAPYGGHAKPMHFRLATGNLFFVVDPTPAVDVDFTSLEQALAFFATVYLGFANIATVTIRGQHVLVPASGIRPSLIQGSQWVFTGTGSPTRPAKGSISATKATALTYLRTQYATEIVSTSTMFILNGMNIGLWKDILFSASAAGASSGCVQSTDGLISRNSQVGSARFINCAFHGWDAAGAGGFVVPGGSTIEGSLLLFSHCNNGIISGYGSVKAPSSVFAQCVRDASATYGAVVDVASSTTTSVSASGWLASTRGYLDARSAENIGAVSAASNGIVQV